MKNLSNLLGSLVLPFIFSLSVQASDCDQSPVKNSSQLVVNIVENDKDINSVTYIFENNKMIRSFAGVVGRSGISFEKREGDGKAPAGVFALTSSFGLAKSLENQSFAYTKVGKDSHCIDDVNHPKYNQMLYSFKKPEGIRSENLSKVGAPYEYAVVVDYNSIESGNAVKGKGSCIFLHIQKKDEKGKVKPTAGCTAYEREHMLFIVNWLDKNKKPKLVQLTRDDYNKRQKDWCLPQI